jgi:2-polyprenyl-6-methoxyphenol hydroxylase-like FAD-dependent oxidoreductase
VLEKARTPEEIYRTGRAGLFDHTSYSIVKQYGLSNRIDSPEWLAPPNGRHRSCVFSSVESNPQIEQAVDTVDGGFNAKGSSDFLAKEGFHRTAVEWRPPEVIERDFPNSESEKHSFFNPLYPQTELVLDMHKKAQQLGIDIRWGVEVQEVLNWEPNGAVSKIDVSGPESDEMEDGVIAAADAAGGNGTGFDGKSGPTSRYAYQNVVIKARQVSTPDGTPLDDGSQVSFTLTASFVVGCAGYHDPVRKAMKTSSTGLYKEEAVDWGAVTMGIFADAKPSTTKIIYGYHPEGMAAHMIRTNEKSRYYIELPQSDVEAAEKAGGSSRAEQQKVLEAIWADERKVWDTLKKRLGLPDLHTGPITSKQFFRTQHFVVETMNLGRACVAGDAAHSRPYLGARGANNAIQDAYVLAELIVKSYHQSSDSDTNFSETDLSLYAKRRLPCIWESARFTHDFYRMCFAADTSSKQGRFYQKMGRPILESLRESMEIMEREKKHTVENEEEGTNFGANPVDDDEIDMTARWFAYCYVQPCVLPEDASINDWLQINPAGKGVNKVRKSSPSGIGNLTSTGRLN